VEWGQPVVNLARECYRERPILLANEDEDRYADFLVHGGRG
jgi:hypothetical protein